ncbi:MAG: DUF1080 domain-containing protein [Flavisolibacter sp.]
MQNIYNFKKCDMRQYWLAVLLLYPFLVGNSFKQQAEKGKWVSLFNGKSFDGWDTYLGPDLDDAGKKIKEQPIGLNNDPKNVFTIVKLNNESVIRISGENWGALSTKNQFSNYHLQLMFKWGELKWGQKKGKKKDSGILYHSVGDYGADYGAWMRSQEFQIEQGNCGDYWGVAGGMEDIPALRKSDSEYVYSRGAEIHTFSANSKEGRHCIKNGDAEFDDGKWNKVDLYCHGDTSVHLVNGKVMMVLYGSSQLEKGERFPLVKGKLQIQSEGAEVFYKAILIQQIKKIPEQYLR